MQRPFADLDLLLMEADLDRQLTRDQAEIEQRRRAEQDRLDRLADDRRAKVKRKQDRASV